MAVHDETRTRLIEAAGAVFAEAGFQAATIRDICARANVNVAAVNYHFGDKLGLYSAVLLDAARQPNNGDTEEFSRGASLPVDRLCLFVRAMLGSHFAEDSPSKQVNLMTHELAQPTAALTTVVDQVIRPKYEGLCEFLATLTGQPRLDPLTRLCAHSIIGQVTHYAHGRAVIHQLWPELEMNSETLDQIAAHIAAFSLAGVESVRQERKIECNP